MDDHNEHNEPDECPICYETITNLYVTSCSHKFCESCINKWKDTHAKTCPMCRTNIFVDSNSKNDNYTYQPTGTMDIHIFAMQYNILRIMSGTAGLSYSS